MELERREPELIQQLQARAAAWCEANGLPELAIDHAQAAGDADRAARLVESLAFPTYASGRAQSPGWRCCARCCAATTWTRRGSS